MNCQRFENVVSELARGQMMAAEQRAEALAHKDVCEQCAARLGDEEMLTRGLRALGAEMEVLAAPADVENKLREAFRTRHTVAPVASRRANSRYWLAAVAAMLLLAISLVVFKWNRSSVQPQQAKQQDQIQNNSVVPGVDDKQQEVAVETKEQSEPLPQRLKPKRNRRTVVPRQQNPQIANHVRNEIATDFIPLSYMTAANLQDGGQIIRVELPRSALANFGLPVNMERYNEKVKADVLLGVDGLAHAIRFVQ